MQYLFRSIFQQLRTLKKEEPAIAAAISAALREHVALYHQTKVSLTNKIKKQQDHQLPSSFLRFIQWVNSSNTMIAFRSKIRLVQIFTSCNPYVDASGHLKKDKVPQQLKILEEDKQFLSLKTEKEKELVKTVMKKVFMGQEKYDYKNLTKFFGYLRAEITFQQEGGSLEQLQPGKREYVERVLRRQIYVSEQYLKAYQVMFGVHSQSHFHKVVDSYIGSRYILVDFEDCSERQKQRNK